MTTISPNTLLTQLKRRYATKQFDPQKKISAAHWAALEESPAGYRAATDKYATAAKVCFPKTEVLVEV